MKVSLKKLNIQYSSGIDVNLLKKRLVKSNRIRLGSIQKTQNNRSIKQNMKDGLKRFYNQSTQYQNSGRNSNEQKSAHKQLRLSVLKKFQILPQLQRNQKENTHKTFDFFIRKKQIVNCTRKEIALKNDNLNIESLEELIILFGKINTLHKQFQQISKITQNQHVNFIKIEDSLQQFKANKDLHSILLFIKRKIVQRFFCNLIIFQITCLELYIIELQFNELIDYSVSKKSFLICFNGFVLLLSYLIYHVNLLQGKGARRIINILIKDFTYVQNTLLRDQQQQFEQQFLQIEQQMTLILNDLHQMTSQDQRNYLKKVKEIFGCSGDVNMDSFFKNSNEYFYNKKKFLTQSLESEVKKDIFLVLRIEENFSSFGKEKKIFIQKGFFKFYEQVKKIFKVILATQLDEKLFLKYFSQFQECSKIIYLKQIDDENINFKHLNLNPNNTLIVDWNFNFFKQDNKNKIIISKFTEKNQTNLDQLFKILKNICLSNKLNIPELIKMNKYINKENFQKIIQFLKKKSSLNNKQLSNYIYLFKNS